MPDSADSTPDKKGPVPLVIGVTGHRALPFVKGDDGELAIAPPIEEEVREFFGRLQRDYDATPLILLSAFSPGADCLVAQIAIDAGIRVVPVLPVNIDKHLRANKGGFKTRYPFSDERFKALLDDEGVDKRHIVMPEATCGEPGALYKNAGVSTIPHLLAGVFVARHCQILLALWNGENEKDLRTGACESGGTAQNVYFQMAGELPRAEGLEDCLRNLDEPYSIKRSFVDEPETGLVYHIDTNLSADRTPHEAHFLSSSERNKKSDREHQDYVKRFKKIYTNINTLNKDTLSLLPSRKQEIDASASGLLDDTKCSLAEPLRELRGTYAVADVLAVHFRDMTHWMLTVIFWLVGIAAAAFVYYAHLTEPAGRYLPLGGYMLLLAIAIAVFLAVRQRSFQDKYQDYRALAEGLRVEFFWRLAGISSCSSGYYLRKHKNELEWIRGAVRSCALLAGVAEQVRPELLLEYWIEEQHRYFGPKSMYYHRRRMRFREIGEGVLLVSLGLSLFVLLHNYKNTITTWLGAFAAAALLALVIFNLIEIVRGADEAQQDGEAARSSNDQVGSSSGVNASEDQRGKAPPQSSEPYWKKLAARIPFAFPYAISLGLLLYQVVLYSKGASLHGWDLAPGFAVVITGLLDILQRVMNRAKIRIGNLISSLKNNLYGLNIGLLIVVALLHNHHIVPEFLSLLLKHEEDSHDILVAAMGLTALIAAMLQTYAERRALAEQHKQCKRMKHIFARAKLCMTELINANRPDEATELVRELGKAALEEHGDWVMLHRERPIELPRAEI
jgi:hypothetical protein